MHNSPIQPYGNFLDLLDEFKLICEKRTLQKALISNRNLQESVKFLILCAPVVSHEARSVFDSCDYYWHWSGGLGGVLHILAPDLIAALSRLDEFLTALYAVTRVTTVAIGDGKTLIRLNYWEGQWTQR